MSRISNSRQWKLKSLLNRMFSLRRPYAPDFDMLEPRMLMSASSTEAYALLGGSSLTQVALNLASTSVVESNVGQTELDFVRNGMTGSLTVNFTVTGTAKRGTDYVIQDESGKVVTGNSVTIKSGNDREKLYIVNISDNIGEGDEYLKIALASSKLYSTQEGYSTAIVTIKDDEPVVSVTATGGSGSGYGNPFYITQTLTGDLNGDGVTDIVNVYANSAQESDGTNYIQVLLGSKSSPGTFAQPAFYTISDSTVGTIKLVDLNGDKKLDMVVNYLTGQSIAESNIAVFLNTGKGTFNDPTNYAVSNMVINNLTIADVNADGKQDIILFTFSQDTNTNIEMANYAIMLNNGKGAFGGMTTTVMSQATSNNAYIDYERSLVADINGDKKLDLVLVTYDSEGGLTLSTALGKGKLGFATATSTVLLTADKKIDQALIDDINGDGKADILAVVRSENATVAGTYDFSAHLFINDGTGVVAAASDTLSLLTGVKSDYEVNDLSLKNLNSHKEAELLFVPCDGSTGKCDPLQIFTNLTNVFSSGQMTYAFSSDADNLSFADLNGDGMLDIVISGEYDSTGNHNYIPRVDVLMNLGNDIFKDAVSYSATQMGTKLDDILVADINGDGKKDLIFSSSANEATRVLVNNGDGTFSQQANVKENGAAMTFTVSRTGDTTDAMSVSYALTGSATLGKDYTLTYADGSAVSKTVIVIPAGQASVTITLTPTDTANLVEATESVRLLLKNGTGYQASATQQGMLIALEDSAPTLSVYATDDTAAEVVSGQTVNYGRMVLNRTGSATDALTANFIIGGTAKRGVDYVLTVEDLSNKDKKIGLGDEPDTLTGNTVTFAEGVNTLIIHVVPIGDDLVEKAETVTLSLVASKQKWSLNASATSASVTLNDLAVPVVTVSPTKPTISEQTPNTAGVFTFTRTGGDLSSALTVNYIVSGTATAGSDYQALSGTVTFAAGKSTVTVNVNAIDDVIEEQNETIVVTLAASGAGLYKVAGTKNAAAMTIKDYEVAPDSPSGSILKLSYKAAEIASGKTVSDSVTIYMGSGKCFLVDSDDITGGTYVYNKTSSTTATLTTTQVDGEVHELNLTFTSATSAKISSGNIYQGQTKTGTMTGSGNYGTPKSTYLPADLIGLEFQGKLLGNSEKLHTNQIATLTFDAANVTVQDWDGTESLGYTYAAVAPAFGLLTYADGSKFLVQYSSNTKAQYWEYDTSEGADYWEFGTITIKQPAKTL